MGRDLTITYGSPARAPLWPLWLGPVLEAPKHFQPRHDQYDALKEAATAGRAAVLSGPSGTGKSHLAAAYARELIAADKLDLVVWAPADDRVGTITLYARAARHVGIGDPDDPEAAANLFLGWLATTDLRWMIVLDNIENAIDLAGLWPVARAGIGRVVATTVRQDGSLFSGRNRILLDVFTPDQAYDYLQQRIPASMADDLAGVADDLGRSPLALSHASAYLIDQDLPCSAYRALFADKTLRLDELFPHLHELFDGSVRTVAATMTLAIDRANQVPPAGVATALLFRSQPGN